MLILEQLKRLILLQILVRAGNTRVFFIFEEAKETVLDFSRVTVKVLQMYWIIILIYLI